jgi:hypothetical protein
MNAVIFLRRTSDLSCLIAASNVMAGTKQEHGVRLDRRNDLLQGKASDVPLIVPGKPEESRITKVLEHSKDDIAMPPSKKLSDAEIAAVHKWIADGAVWPETSDLETEARRRAEKWREHWAFQPVPVSGSVRRPGRTTSC